ncbi:MAG: hypothetical protein ACRCZZ_10445 [Phocaeicola sp.]
MKNQGIKCGAELDLILARGLNYYTDTIFEMKEQKIMLKNMTIGEQSLLAVEDLIKFLA